MTKTEDRAANPAASDLRSDTVTQPSTAMREAMARAVVGDDVNHDDPTVRALEEEAASLLGKEDALFVVSGTMGNQLALLAAGRPGEELVLPESCHIVQHEAGAAARFAGLQLRTLDLPLGIPEREAFAQRIRQTPEDVHSPRTGLFSYENATSDGAVVPLEGMAELAELARAHGIHVHLDGARLFNAAIALEAEPRELAQHCDTLSVCLSKGLGAPVGSLLCGHNDVIARARRARKQLGGGWRQAGHLAAAGQLALRDWPQLATDHVRAEQLAQQMAHVDGVELLTERRAINMVFFRLAGGDAADRALLDAATSGGLKLYPPEAGLWRVVLHRDVSDEALAQFVALLGALPPY